MLILAINKGATFAIIFMLMTEAIVQANPKRRIVQKDNTKTMTIAQMQLLNNRLWLLEMDKAMMQTQANMLKDAYWYDKELAAKERKALKPTYYKLSHDNEGVDGNFRKADVDEKGSYVAVVKIKGVMLKEDIPCGPRGTESIVKDIEKAYKAANVIAIVIDVDTPGGMVSGIEALSQIIALKEKPVVAFVNDQTCSAGYWAIAGADHIVASGQNAMVGSIGGMCSWLDTRQALADMGLLEVVVYAPQSKRKNEGYREYEANGTTDIIEREIGFITKNFIDTVKKYRGDKINAEMDNGGVYEGAVYMGKDALKIGLVDEIGNMDIAIKKAISLAKKSNPSGSRNSAHSNSDNDIVFFLNN